MPGSVVSLVGVVLLAFALFTDTTTPGKREDAHTLLGWGCVLIAVGSALVKP